MKARLGDVGHTHRRQFYWVKIEDVIKLIDELLPKYCEDGADEFAGQLKSELELSAGGKDGVR